MPSSTATEPTTELVQLKPSQLVPHPKNIRGDVGDVSSLADSIAAQGIREPLIVAPNGKPDRYILIAGHRRLAAAKKNRLKTVPCVIDHGLIDEADQIAAMLAENVERQDLTAVEEADGVALLLDLNLNQKQIASRTGMSSSRVRNRVKVSKLSDDVKARLNEHDVTLADAVFIADHADHPGDLAELENALGTNNWAVAKQKQQDRDAERKRAAAIRKAAEAAGIEVVTGWDARRELNSSAPEKLGTTHGAMVRNEYAWPVAAVVLETAQRADTVAYLHIAGSRTLMVGGKYVSEALVVLSAPELVDAATSTPTTATDDAPSSTTAGAGDAPTPAAQDPQNEGAVQEPTAEAAAELDRESTRDAANEVRRAYIRGLVAEGDRDVANQFSQFAARALQDLREWGLDDDQFPHPRLARYLISDDTAAEYSHEMADKVFGWLREVGNPHSALLAWALHYLVPVEEWIARPVPDEHDMTALRVLIAYIDLLAECGHVLSDVEIEARDAFQAALNDEESTDED
ncbi:ParB-like nuclease domain protein [Gordonia phage Dogfish]|nr:ParB-like nuclease domain protein [Gordonia phage Dogfish]